MMNSYYSIFLGQDKQTYWNLKAGNHEIILQSEGYKSKQGALTGIKSVQTNCTDENNYIRKTATDGSPYFVLKAGNGETIGKSEMYSSEQARDRGLKSVMKNGITQIIKGDLVSEIRIKINKKSFVVTEKKMLGRGILKLAGLDSSRYCLYLLCGNKQEEIKPDQSVKIENGLSFQAILNDIKFG